ncbi:MAG: hypothetical protein ACUVX1_07105 [Chloroflexota bacterium]
MDPYLREGQYEKQWQLLEANGSKVKMIILYGWNLYGEQAHIEPSWGDPAPVGTAYVEKTKDLYAHFLENR